MGDFIYDNAGKILIVLISFMFYLNIDASNKQEKQRAVFMAQCTQDHKQYECDVMWGGTRESKAASEMATNMAIGAAAGAIAGRR